QAARLSFPDVRFTAPTESPPEPAAPPAQVLLPVRPRLSRPRSWRRWAVAAAVLLAFTGVSVPAHRAHEGYTGAQRVVADHEEAVADARDAVEVAQEELKKAATQRDEKIAQIQHEIKAREVRLVVSPPPTLQPRA